jgi:hypothetical protein
MGNFVHQKKWNTLIRNMSGMSRHPGTTMIEIVGIKEDGRGRSCEEHDVCGTALYIDAVVRLQAIQILNGENFCGVIFYFV